MAGYREVSKEFALAEIRRYAIAYPDSPPEMPAMGLMRRIDSWEEHTAILKALDEVLAEAKAHRLAVEQAHVDCWDEDH